MKMPPYPCALLLAATLIARLPATAVGQSVVARTPNLGGVWTAPAGVVQFNFMHRFSISDPPQRRIFNTPTFNVGTGRGYSVLEIIRCAAEMLGVEPEVRFEERRAGDPPSLIADASELRRATGWAPLHSGLTEIIGSALAWERIREAARHAA